MLSGLSADAATNTWYFDALSESELPDIDLELSQVYNDVLGVMSKDIDSTLILYQWYDMSQAEPRLPIREQIRVGNATGGDTLPHEVALCMSYEGARLSGKPQRNRRGRLYFGPLASNSLDVTTGRPSLALLILLQMMVMGGMAGSTSGGLKGLRTLIGLRALASVFAIALVPVNGGGLGLRVHDAVGPPGGQIAVVLRTYASVFNRVAVWFTMGPDLLLIGFNDSARALDLESLERAASRPDVAEGLRKAGVKSFPALLAHELVPVGVIHAVPRSGPLHSLYHPRLSYQAGRAFFRGARARLPFTGSREQAQVAARTSLLRRYAVRFDGELPDDVRTQVLEETCRHRLTKCATLLASWANDGMDLAGLKQGFGSALEHPDQGLDWSMVTRLAPLFGDPEPDRGQRVPLESARSATQRYSTYYHHAAPFDGDTLLDLWRRCEAPPERPQACRRGLEEARSLLGDRGPS